MLDPKFAGTISALVLMGVLCSCAQLQPNPVPVPEPVKTAPPPVEPVAAEKPASPVSGSKTKPNGSDTPAPRPPPKPQTPQDTSKNKADGTPGATVQTAEALEGTPAHAAFKNAESAEKAKQLDKAFGFYSQAADGGYPGAAARAAVLKAKLIEIYSRAARSALARQNLDASLENWDRVLQLHPAEETALLEKKKVLRLKEALRNK